MEVDSDGTNLVDAAEAASGGNMESMDISDVGEPERLPIFETFTTVLDMDNLNLQTSQAEVRDPQVPYNTGKPSGSGQDAALTPPEVAPPPSAMELPSAALAAPIDKERLTEAATEMYTGDRGAPAASTKPPLTTEPSRELVIKAREVISTVFKSAGLAAVRLTWGRLVDKREALYYLLGWALGRGLLPVTDRPHGDAGILGDKYWKWADAYEIELADQKKAAGRLKSKLSAAELDKHNVDTADARNRLLRAVIVLDLPSPQRAAAVERHARPKPTPPIQPSSYREPDLAAELAEADAELNEAAIFHKVASLKAERTAKAADKTLSTDPPPPPGPLRDMYLDGTMDKKYVAKVMPVRERKRREAEVKQHDAVLHRTKEAQLAEMEAALEVERANLKGTEARARVAERERKEKLAAELLAAANEKGLAQLRLERLEARMAEHAAREAGIEAQLAQLRVVTAAAEAAEAPPVGVPVATSSMNVVQGELV